jgi:uncharacterized protein YkwD
MSKIFLDGFILLALLAFFPRVAPAQTETARRTITAQAVGYVGRGSGGGGGETNSENSTENHSRIVFKSETKKATAFELERKVLELINGQRAAKNLPPLAWSDDLGKIARLHSENMARFKFFSHVGRDGQSIDDRADAAGVTKWRAIGENIAYNRGFENPAEFALQGWLKSASHRENLLSNRWRETGVGVAIAEDGTFYFTQVFLVR